MEEEAHEEVEEEEEEDEVEVKVIHLIPEPEIQFVIPMSPL